MTKFHHSPLSSDRIQRVLRALQQAGSAGMTTFALNEACASTRVSSDISEARACGVQIECIFVGTNENGRRVHRYRLAEDQGRLL